MFRYTVKLSDTESKLVEVFTMNAHNVHEVVYIVSELSQFDKPRLVYIKRKQKNTHSIV